MSTPLTNEKADEIVKALNEVTAELQNCLKTVGGGPATTSGAPVAGGAGGAGGGSSTSALLPPPPPPSSTIKLNLLLKVANADATDAEECRITSAVTTDLIPSHKGEFWFNHQVELSSNSSSGIGLTVGGTIAAGAVTFLKETGSPDADVKNANEITIQQDFVDNIIKAIDENTKGQIDVVYLKYDVVNNPPWSVVADGTDASSTIQLVPDIVVGKGASDANKYIISFADESNFADGKQIKLMDGTTEVTANADTITQINAGLETNPISIIKGGRRRRQTRKGGKRYRRKSRRFR